MHLRLIYTVPKNTFKEICYWLRHLELIRYRVGCTTAHVLGTSRSIAVIVVLDVSDTQSNTANCVLDNGRIHYEYMYMISETGSKCVRVGGGNNINK